MPPERFIRLCRYWDKAATQDDGCFTVGVLMGVDIQGRFWILDVVRGQWNSAKREMIIKQTADMDYRKYGRDVLIRVEQEPGSGGKESAEATIKNLAGFRCQADRPTGDKIQRADPFSYQVNVGNVLIVPGEWNKVYLDELQYFPNSKYKDQTDATSGAFATLFKKRKKVGGMFSKNK
jgi:predicted phage terminase large subunit-like protein